MMYADNHSAGIEDEWLVEQPAPDGSRVLSWRRTRGTITEDSRILVQMSDGTKNPPWLELDDAGQHWMLDMINEAQEVRR
jgi:hypothetical protein